MVKPLRCHSCHMEVTAFMPRCPRCYVALHMELPTREPIPVGAVTQPAPEEARPSVAALPRGDNPPAPPYRAAPTYGPPSGYGPPPAGVPGHGHIWPPHRPTYEYATWTQRVEASLIDASIPFAGLLVTIWAAMAFPGTVLGILGVWLALAGDVFFIWQVYVRQGQTGQTFGKAKVGISLRRESDLAPLGIGMNIARQLAHCLDGVLCIGYLWPLWDIKRQTFADMLCHSVVVVD